jgi:hypothetical protein
MVMARRKHERKGLPDWAKAPFHRFLDQLEQVSQLVHLSAHGIAMITALPKAIEVLADTEDLVADAQEEFAKEGGDSTEPKPQETSDSKDQRLKRAREEAELAQREVDNEFPLLHAQAAISIWAALEALIHSFLAGWLTNEPSAKDVEEVRKLRIRLWEYDAMDMQERCLHTVALLDQELGTPLSHGVTRFERLLAPFGLAGSVDDDVKKALFEMNHVRNVLVHREGIADRRLAEACPWLQVKPGDPVVVRHETFARYAGAAHDYVLELIQRVRERFGLKRYEG